MAEHVFEIQGDGGFVRLAFGPRAYPEAQDYWDGNWVVTRIQADAPGFQADFADQVHLGDVVLFYESVLKMHAALAGEATLAMMEEFLIVTGTLDVHGGLLWSDLLAHPSRRGARLQFAFRSDQSFLAGLIDQLEHLLTEFGVRGRPPKRPTQE